MLKFVEDLTGHSKDVLSIELFPEGWIAQVEVTSPRGIYTQRSIDLYISDLGRLPRETIWGDWE